MPPGDLPVNRSPGRVRQQHTAQSDNNEITPDGARTRLERAYADRADGWAIRRARRNDLRTKTRPRLSEHRL